MELTNRVLIVGATLLGIFLILVVILLTWGAPDESIDALADLAGYLEDHNDRAAKLIITFGALILLLLGALVIIFEVAPPETGSLPVANVGSGEARISTEEVVMRLEEEILALPQVGHVQAVVQGRGSKADVNLDLHVRPEVDLAATTEEVCRLARQLVEERMGVALARPPQAQLHYRELRVAPQPTQSGPGAHGSAASAPPPEAPTEPPGSSTGERTPAETPSESVAGSGSESAPGPMEPRHETTEAPEDRPAGG